MMQELTIAAQIGFWLAALWCARSIWRMDRPRPNRRWTENEEAWILRAKSIWRVR